MVMRIDELRSLLRRLAGVRVLVVGDAMLDHYVMGRVERISPEAPVPVLRVEREFDRPGGAANVAANIASLGGRAALISLAGGAGGKLDSDGRYLWEKCRAFTSPPPVFLPGLSRTVRKTRFLAGKQQILRVDWEEAAPALSAGWQKRRAAAIRRSLRQCQAILVSDYAKGMVDAELMAQLRASGKPLIVDTRPQHADLYRGATLITPNRQEALRMLRAGEGRGGSTDSMALAKRLARQMRCSALVTLGEEGMCLALRNGEADMIPTCRVEVADGTGAGDTVAAAMAMGIAAGLPLLAAAHIANAAGRVVVQHIGTACATPDEVAAALADIYS